MREHDAVGGKCMQCKCMRETWYCLDFTIVTRRIVGEWMGRFAHLERAHVLCGL